MRARCTRPERRSLARSLARAALLGVPFVLMIALVTPRRARGLTVVPRLGELGPLGQFDVMRESLVWGALLGLRALLVVLTCGVLLATGAVCGGGGGLWPGGVPGHES